MPKESWGGPYSRLDDNRITIPRSYKSCMKTDGIIYCDKTLEKKLLADNAPEQVANVACLPGIVGNSIAMPDVHWGYGFPIGGVAAFSEKDGIISPGGVGYDINCGVRLIRTDIRAHDVIKQIPIVVAEIFKNIPTGIGSSGRYVTNPKEFPDILTHGAKWAIKKVLVSVAIGNTSKRTARWREQTLTTSQKRRINEAPHKLAHLVLATTSSRFKR